MKRLLIFALPILAAALVVGFGAFLFRAQGPAIKARLGGVGEAVAEAVGEAVEELVEELQEKREEATE